MSFFEQGGLLYGIVYSLWRGSLAARCRLWTEFYRRVVAECGAGTIFRTNIYMAYPKRIRIGRNCSFGERVVIYAQDSAGSLTIADGVEISDGVVLDFTGNVSIGRNAIISSGVSIYTHDHGRDPHARPIACDLTIEENVWIGAGAYVLPHVQKIGQGAIIGAGSIVTAPVPQSVVIAGNPGRVLAQQNGADRTTMQTWEAV